MPYARYTAWPPGYYQTCCAQSGTIWAWVLPCAHGRHSNTVQPYRSVFLGRWSYQMEQSCRKAMPWRYQPFECKFQRVNPGLLEAATRVSNVGDQLICWLCIAKKPAFMLIHEFMQRQTQLFSILDNAYLHQTMKLPTAASKSSLRNSRRISTSSETNKTVLPPSLCQKWRT